MTFIIRTNREPFVAESLGYMFQAAIYLVWRRDPVGKMVHVIHGCSLAVKSALVGTIVTDLF